MNGRPRNRRRSDENQVGGREGTGAGAGAGKAARGGSAMEIGTLPGGHSGGPVETADTPAGYPQNRTRQADFLAWGPIFARFGEQPIAVPLARGLVEMPVRLLRLPRLENPRGVVSRVRVPPMENSDDIRTPGNRFVASPGWTVCRVVGRIDEMSQRVRLSSDPAIWVSFLRIGNTFISHPVRAGDVERGQPLERCEFLEPRIRNCPNESKIERGEFGE